MARVKRGVTSRAKHKKVLKAVKGQWGRRKNTIRVAKQAMEKAMQYAYRDRRNKKRDFKKSLLKFGRGSRTRTLTNGFGDRHATITPILYNHMIEPFLT